MRQIILDTETTGLSAETGGTSCGHVEVVYDMTDQLLLGGSHARPHLPIVWGCPNSTHHRKYALEHASSG